MPSETRPMCECLARANRSPPAPAPPIRPIQGANVATDERDDAKPRSEGARLHRGLVAAREKAADAGGCQDVLSHSSADQRLKEGFGAGREIRERGQRHRS